MAQTAMSSNPSNQVVSPPAAMDFTTKTISAIAISSGLVEPFDIVLTFFPLPWGRGFGFDRGWLRPRGLGDRNEGVTNRMDSGEAPR